MCRRDFDDVAGAEIMDRDDAAERLVGGVDRGEPDQVGVIIFISSVAGSLSRGT